MTSSAMTTWRSRTSWTALRGHPFTTIASARLYGMWRLVGKHWRVWTQRSLSILSMWMLASRSWSVWEGLVEWQFCSSAMSLGLLFNLGSIPSCEIELLPLFLKLKVCSSVFVVGIRPCIFTYCNYRFYVASCAWEDSNRPKFSLVFVGKNEF